MADTLPSNATDLDPYAVLEVPSSATAAEIRSAYRKLALKCHPDKTPVSEREEAHKKFQELAFCYAVLSDENRRRRYDATGNMNESVLDQERFDWKEFFKMQFQKVGADAIEEFKRGYQGSDEEKQAVLQAYTDGEGDMSYVFEHVMVSSILEDEERFRVIIDDAIKAGEVEGYKAYTKETKASKEKRRKAAKAEAKEAEEYAKELGVHDVLFKNKKVAVQEEAEEAQADEEEEEEDEEEEEEVKPKKKASRGAPKKKAPAKEAPAKKAAPKKKAKKDEEDISALADLIKSRQQGRMGSLIANIEEKYGGGAGTKRSSPKISEEDFQKAQERVTRRSKRTKA
ncbi:hypothetical protein BZA77DRAFT_310378 [Pyronema omphalodes]|nr:hypothetical protein BZA77DRAFT_310378 [Pyronema omphalodes]